MTPRISLTPARPSPTWNFPAILATRLPLLSRIISQSIPEANSPIRLEFDCLARETDPELLNQGLLNFGVRQEHAGREELALAVFSALREGPLASRAQSHIDALMGRGSNQARLPVLLGHFLAEVSSPSSLIGMAGAQATFGLSRMALLSRITASPTASIWTRGVGARFAASTGAFLLEAPSFVAFSRGTRAVLGQSQDWSLRALGRETAGSYLTLGALRGSGALAGAIGRPLSNLNPALRSTLPTAVSQIGMFGGILLSRELETRAGLRERINGATTLLDSLATLLQFQVAGHLVHRAFPRLAAFHRQLHGQGDLAAQARPVGSWFRRLPRWGRDLALAPMWMMMGVPGPGEGGDPPRVPPHIFEFLREFEKPEVAPENRYNILRRFLTGLSESSMDPELFAASIRGMIDGALERDMLDLVLDPTMDFVAAMDPLRPGPREFIRRVVEGPRPTAFMAEDVMFHTSLLRNPHLPAGDARALQAHLTEFLRVDEALVDVGGRAILFDEINTFLATDTAPPEIRAALVREALAYASRQPDGFYLCNGAKMARTLLRRGDSLSIAETKSLLSTMADRVNSDELTSDDRASLMATLDLMASHRNLPEEISMALQAQMSAIRSRFYDYNLDHLNGNPVYLNAPELGYLIEQAYVTEHQLQALSQGIHRLFWREPRFSVNYNYAAALAEAAIRQGRLGTESRRSMAAILLRSFSDVRQGPSSEITQRWEQRHRELIRSLPRADLENLAVRFSENLTSDVDAERQRASAILTDLLPLVRGSFTVRGHLSRALNQNRRRGLNAFQDLLNIFEGRPR